jgi:hypothetical protein
LWTWTDHDADLHTVLTRERVLDEVTLYWLTGTGASSARTYWESIDQFARWLSEPKAEIVTVPAGCSVFDLRAFFHIMRQAPAPSASTSG